jgi:hypothetical protein
MISNLTIFLMGMEKRGSQVNIMDFGLAKKFHGPKAHLHIPYRENKNLTGTARYTPITTHLGPISSRLCSLKKEEIRRKLSTAISESPVPRLISEPHIIHDTNKETLHNHVIRITTSSYNIFNITAGRGTRP